MNHRRLGRTGLEVSEIPGMRSIRTVERNLAVDGGLAEEQVERLRAHRWERDFYR